MEAALNRWVRFHVSIVVLLVIALCWPALAAQKQGSSSQPPASTSSDSTELVSGGDNPVLRVAAAHYDGRSIRCFGYLYVTRDTIRFEVLQPKEDTACSFEFRRASLVYAGKWWSNLAKLQFSSGGSGKFLQKVADHHFIALRKSLVEHAGSITFNEAIANEASFQEIVSAASNFYDVVARLEAEQARLHPPSVVAPTISLLEPGGVEAGKTLDTTLARLHLRGVVSHASGISAVSINGQAAFLKTLASQSVEFDMQDIAVNPGRNGIVVQATATDKSLGQLTFTVSRAEVRILDPAANSETVESTIKVRGLAVGFHEVEKVEVAGTAASLRKQADGEVEFVAEGIPLAVGSNTVQGVVTASNGTRENFQVTLQRRALPLTLKEVQKALHDGVSPARLSALVAKFGVDFSLNADTEKSLRAVGADNTLLGVIANAKK